MLFDSIRGNGTKEGSQHKIVIDQTALKKQIEACRQLGARIVATIGSWDMLHIGHLRYLIEAASLGDILVVGVDSDRAVKLYKGPDRPIIPQEERLEMLSYQSCVNFVTLVDDVTDRGTWQYGLARSLKPDFFVGVEGSYPERQQRVISRHCSKLVILPRQAENTSTTDIIQSLIKGQMLEIIKKMGRGAP